MSTIIPAILPTSFGDLNEKLAALEGLVTEVQIDMVDGKFASPSSWPYAESAQSYAAFMQQGGMLPHVGTLHFEMDLMIQNPEQSAGQWISAGAERITLHAESTNYLAELIRDLEVTYGHAKGFAPDLLSLGLALNISTDTAIIEPFLDRIDYVQFMGIDTIGRQAQSFDPKVLRKIRAFKSKYPAMPIQVDGGVSLRTAPELLKVGVERLIIGSALWNAPSLASGLQEFTALVEEYGIYS